MASNEKLLPCPFCGGTNIKVIGRFNGRYSTYQAICKCGAEGRGSSHSGGEHIAYAEASKSWNTRATQPVPVDEYVLLSDTVESEHPEYGMGLFATPDCVRKVDTQPVAVDGMPGRVSEENCITTEQEQYASGANSMHDAFTAWLSKAATGLPRRKLHQFDSDIEEAHAEGWNDCHDAVSPLVAGLRAEIERLGEMLAKAISLNFDTRQERDTLRTANEAMAVKLRWILATENISQDEAKRISALLASAGGDNHG